MLVFTSVELGVAFCFLGVLRVGIRLLYVPITGFTTDLHPQPLINATESLLTPMVTVMGEVDEELKNTTSPL